MNLIREAEAQLTQQFQRYEQIAYANQEKVLKAMQKHHLRDSHFNTSSGYGYGDMGRDDLESIYAAVLGAEDAMVRSQIVSGTHAISACLMALLRPGDELVAIMGKPYDTLGKVIGRSVQDKATLLNRGIKYREVPLTPEGQPNYEVLTDYVGSSTKMVLIQRSRGYNLRPSLTIDELRRLIGRLRTINPHLIIFVDNCYGEFTDTLEPNQVGADLIAGSLIKNPGGGLAPAGGYIAGGRELVEEVAYHITAPGLGKELGASLQNNRLLYQGLFLAPHIVLQAMKGALLLSYVFERIGYKCYPRFNEQRGDIVQAVRMNSAEEVINFCQVVQNSSPVDSDVTLEYAPLPGYTDKIVMAAGTFIQGSSIEISCDAPLREPYTVYYQGGLTYEHCRYVVSQLLKNFM